MNFQPPESFNRLAALRLNEEGELFGYDLEWCPVMRWVEYDPERLLPYEKEHNIGQYFMFAKTAGGDPWCWHAGLPTNGDEFEVHEVDLFMYIPRAPSFIGFLFLQHVEGFLSHKKEPDLDFQIKNDEAIVKAFFPPVFIEQAANIEKLVREDIRRGVKTPVAYQAFQKMLEGHFGKRYLR
jgi:hypothetical protein